MNASQRSVTAAFAVVFVILAAQGGWVQKAAAWTIGAVKPGEA